MWGTTGTALTFVPETVDSFVVAALRLAIGGVVLMVVLAFLGRFKFSNWPWKHIWIVSLALALFQYSFFTSVRLTGVAVGTVVTIGSSPIFTGLLESIFLRTRPTRQWFVATSLAVIGCALLFLNKDEVMIHPLGILFALCGGLMFATYSFGNKRIVAKIDTLEAVAIVFVISALLLLPFFFVFSKEGLFTPSGLIAIVYMGVFTTALAYILYSYGLKSIPSSSATTLALAEPFTAAILSVVVVGEMLSRTSWFGVFLLLAGIVILTVQPDVSLLRRSKTLSK